MNINNAYMVTVIHKLLDDIRAKEMDYGANDVKVQISFGRKEAQVLYDALLNSAQEWIPVSERLPERVEWYLTSIKWDDGTERVITSWFDGVSFKAEVIAWMPLPKPYKPQESEEV